MLISTMNHAEVTREVLRDLETIRATTLVRLFNEYDKKRKKLKVKEFRTYPKVYHIKTKTKNPWTIFISKSSSDAVYKSKDNISYCCVVHYHDKNGLRVMRQFKEINGLECFWGHFFNRYNERMALNISSMQERIEHFFIHNGYIQHGISDLETKKNIGICNDGFVFGLLEHDNTWLINKTFVSNSLASKGKHQFAEKLLAEIEGDLIMGLALKKFNAADYLMKMQALAELKRA